MTLELSFLMGCLKKTVIRPTEIAVFFLKKGIFPS